MPTKRRSITLTRLRVPRAALALTVVAFAACSADNVVPTDPPANPKHDAPALATADSSLTISNHLAFWFLSRNPGIYNFVAPMWGASISPQRLSAGYYSTTINGMSDYYHPGNKEIVMTTTYGSKTVQCAVPAWGSSTSVDQLWVTNFCDDMVTKQQVDAEFATLIVGNRSMSGTSAFAVADQFWSASYTPDTARSFTTGTGSMLIQRIGVGDYYVSLGTGSPQGTTYMVNSAYELAICGVGEWKNFGVRVRCYDENGASVDAQFYVLQVGGGRYLLDPYGVTAPYAFAWADQRSATVPYTPNTSYSRSGPRGGPITVTRTSVGDYQVEFVGLEDPFGDPQTVHVTPFGLTYAQCNVTGIQDSPAGTSELVRVKCYDQHGALIDSRFNVLLLR